VRGYARDQTGAPVTAATVIATSPAMSEPMSEITDENGFYELDGLAPGVFAVTFYWGEKKIVHAGIVVSAGETTRLDARIDH
jgi:hypothetical protein